MSEIAIKVEGIGKKYRIGQKKSGEFRETFGNILRSFRPAADSQQPAAQKEFWALKDISFELKQGEAVGIIGRNGAGKSTLLKVLSRITKPTTGRFEINGRVSSLLEVGTGFHPELTGRENIFLNGTILGMRRTEIKAKFDEIIAFSGVEEFIDTPVKHYSSGMKVRLAFSVAAHLEPEILIIDEVLAVGDAEFQKKCLGKMEDVTGEGRTVLFVSHNMGAIEKLCNLSLLLNQGKVEYIGNTEDTIQIYLKHRSNNDSGLYNVDQNVIKVIQIENKGSGTNQFQNKDILELRLRYQTNLKITFPVLGILIKDHLNTPLVGINNKNYIKKNLVKKPTSKGEIKIELPLFQFIPGIYSLDVYLGDRNVDLDSVKDVIGFEIIKRKNEGLVDINSKLNKFYIQDINWELIDG